MCVCVCVCVCVVHVCPCVALQGQIGNCVGGCQFSVHRLPANSHSHFQPCSYFVRTWCSACGVFRRFCRVIWLISHCFAPLLAYLFFCFWPHFLLYNLKLTIILLHRNPERIKWGKSGKERGIVLGTQIVGDKWCLFSFPPTFPPPPSFSFFFPSFSSFLLPSVLHSYISTTSGCFQASGL